MCGVGARVRPRSLDDTGVILMESYEARPGTAVRVKESYRRPELEGMGGIVEHCWGSPDYLALDVRLEDGRSELFWFHQLDTAAPARVAYYDGS